MKFFSRAAEREQAWTLVQTHVRSQLSRPESAEFPPLKKRFFKKSGNMYTISANFKAEKSISGKKEHWGFVAKVERVGKSFKLIDLHFTFPSG